MTMVLPQQQRAGRFGREVRSGDVPTDDAPVTGGDGREEPVRTIDYEVDAQAVAGAIVERLLAGRTITAAPRKRR